MDNEYEGTVFTPSDNCMAWVRVSPPPTYKGKRIMKKKGKFGIWHCKYRYWQLKWFGADPAVNTNV